MNKYFCIIPARGGSKRIPNKNIQDVGGFPLIGHVIKNALESTIFEEVFVSTDSKEIASISREFGAMVPSMRKPDLSDDYTPTRPVIADFIMTQPNLQSETSVVACIYPFAILARAELLRAARDRYEQLNDNGKYLVAIQKYSHPIQRALSLTPEGFLLPISTESLEVRTQDLPATFHDAGQFYFAQSKLWQLDVSVLANSIGFEIPKYSAVDIDDIEDLEELRRIYKP